MASQASESRQSDPSRLQELNRQSVHVNTGAAAVIVCKAKQSKAMYAYQYVKVVLPQLQDVKSWFMIPLPIRGISP